MKKENNLQISCCVPLRETYDVIVTGGGPAGICAAISAARQGMRTAIIERLGYFGGLATAGLVMPVSEFNKNDRRIIRGIPWEIMERLAACDGAILDWRNGNVPFDAECYKMTIEQMLVEEGVEVYLECAFVNCVCDENRVTHIICSSRCGMFALGASCFIDCTGDALLALAAGVPMQEAKEESQPATLCFQIGNVDTDHLENICLSEPNTRYFNKRIKDILLSLDENVPNFGGPWFCRTMDSGVVTANITRAPLDSIEPEYISRAVMQLRKDIFMLVKLLRENVPEFSRCRLLQTASIIGCRDGRRIVGAHTLTAAELLSGEEHYDAIAASAHPVDVHVAHDTSQRVVFLEREGYIPYRSLWNADFPNLLVAGRCLSADSDAYASVRVQAPCMAMGEAVGAAAALSVKNQVSVGDVDVAKLKEILKGE